MLFHTPEFLIFFLAVYPVHLLLRRTRWMNAWLLLASYAFYARANPVYLPLLMTTTLVDYLVVRKMEGSPRKKLWLSISLVTNLGALFFFKYASFFAQNLNAVLSFSGASTQIHPLDPLLPLGISFFTFQSISYAVDVYRGIVPAERNLITYATYVSFFPQMISGPICRAGSLLPQLRKSPRIVTEDLTQGASLYLIGFFKKVALADYLALYVDRIYNAPANYQAPALALATFAFAWQIYFDFSGYIDMARGIARAMGFHLTPNFDAPYVAGSLSDFWGRWNSTVSHWFRDYVYIPLGGGRGGPGRTARNILITMLSSGLWHGASWTFILWGAVHGVGMAATRGLGPLAELSRRTPLALRRLGVFVFVSFAWIFFRARSVEDAGLIVVRLFTSGLADPRFPALLILPIAVVWAYQWLQARAEAAPRFCRFSPLRVGLAIFMIGYLVLVPQAATQQFIYFQF